MTVPATQPSSDVSVRPARPADADAVAAVTVASWQRQYADLLPADGLTGLSARDIAGEWRAAIGSPPSARHAVLVALEANSVVGYAVLAPSPDPDSDEDESRIELVDLVVHPDGTRRGHGSRLLAAAVDHGRRNGGTEILTWCAVGDDPRLVFLTSAGFGPDGASRTLDGESDTDGASGGLRQVRLTSLV